MVDDIVCWPNAWGPFIGGSCHLTTDGPLNELHAFATKIGLRRAWFQDHPRMAHYDLTRGRRDAAIRAGAVYVPGMVQARARRQRRLAGTA